MRMRCINADEMDNDKQNTFKSAQWSHDTVAAKGNTRLLIVYTKTASVEIIKNILRQKTFSP